MSKAEASSAEPAAGVRLASCALDIVEIAARRGRAEDLRRTLHHVELPLLGQVAEGPQSPGGSESSGLQRSGLESSGSESSRRAIEGFPSLVISVRPDRWLILRAPATPGGLVSILQTACAGAGVAVDLSSALTASLLSGPATNDVLARGCRLDPHTLVPGTAVATLMAQVSVVLATLPSGTLLLTPSTTAQHFREWLTATARPFGLPPQSVEMHCHEVFG